MTVSLLGALAFALGLVSLWRDTAFGLVVFALSLLFGAAAGVIFDDLGGVNLMLGHILLAFLCLRTLADPARLTAGLRELAPGRAGFWLALLVVYGALSAVFLPRLFLGVTQVFSVVRGGDPTLGPVMTPLAPVSGNISQTFYFVSDLVCLVVCSAALREKGALAALAVATVVAAALNLGFALLDYASFAAGASDMLSFMRNATYRMLDDVEVLGYKRIVGSFSEASSFATATLAYLAFCARLALLGRWVRVTAPLAALSAVAAIASTSTTGYLGLAALALALYAAALFDTGRGRGSPASSMFLLAAPPALAAILIAVMLQGAWWQEASDLVNQIVLSKWSSDSAHERGAWNAAAMQAFFDTHGVGAGVGSVRASSFEVAVLASLGVPGAALFIPFLAHALARPLRRFALTSLEADIVSAARFGCLALLIAATFAGVFIDLGLPFFVFASMATFDGAWFAASSGRESAERRAGLLARAGGVI